MEKIGAEAVVDNLRKTVWITGASSGIGEGLVYEYVAKNYNVIISARSESSLEKVKVNTKSDFVKILPLDLENHSSLTQKVDQALQLFGAIDILINNAGVSQRSLINDTGMDVYKRLMDINYLGTVTLTKALLPYFNNKKSGKFVVVTSVMGKFGSPYRSGYCGAKHALHGFFDVLRMEHEKDGISVNIICPGFVQTNVAKNALIGDGTLQGTEDVATEGGMSVKEFSIKCVKSIEDNKMESYIGKKEILGVYLKRFFPKLLHKKVLKSQVR